MRQISFFLCCVLCVGVGFAEADVGKHRECLRSARLRTALCLQRFRFHCRQKCAKQKRCVRKHCPKLVHAKKGLVSLCKRCHKEIGVCAACPKAYAQCRAQGQSEGKECKERYLSGGLVGKPCGARHRCIAGAWCNGRDRRCYETCYGTATRAGNTIPRKQRYWCDYGKERPTFQPRGFLRFRVGRPCPCSIGSWCNPKDQRCYETCYGTAARAGNAIPRKRRYWCDYQNALPHLGPLPQINTPPQAPAKGLTAKAQPARAVAKAPASRRAVPKRRALKAPTSRRSSPKAPTSRRASKGGTKSKYPSPPPSEIFLVRLDALRGQIRVRGVQNITRRPKGYDNQPFFLPDGKAVLYTSMRPGRYADIYRYAIASGKTKQLTTSEDAEYSPLLLPKGGFFSAVRVEKDGTQRIWRYPLAGGKGQLLVAGVKEIGYHVWVDADTLLVFVIGPPSHTLQKIQVSKGKAVVLAKGIGRCLQVLPSQRVVSFVHKVSPKAWWIKLYDPRTGKIRAFAKTLPGREDYAWAPDGTLWMGRGSTLYIHNPRTQRWQKAADLARFGIRNITRLAFGPRGRQLAIVSKIP